MESGCEAEAAAVKEVNFATARKKKKPNHTQTPNTSTFALGSSRGAVLAQLCLLIIAEHVDVLPCWLFSSFSSSPFWVLF